MRSIAIAKHNSTGNLHRVELYATFVYFIDEFRQVDIETFREFSLFKANNHTDLHGFRSFHKSGHIFTEVQN